MAMRYGYFDSEITGVDENGMPIFDRAETSDLFRMLFAKLVSNGVLASPGDCFQVLADTGMTVRIRPGFAMIKGAFAYDADESTVTLPAADANLPRLDRVVLRCNYLNRCCEIIVKSGTPATTPVAPALLQPANGDYYELGLTTVRVEAGSVSVSQSSIADTRADSRVCGYITQLIDHIDTSVLMEQLTTWYAEYTTGAQDRLDEFYSDNDAAFTAWFDHIKDQLSEDAAGNLQNQIDNIDDEITGLSSRVDVTETFDERISAIQERMGGSYLPVGTNINNLTKDDSGLWVYNRVNVSGTFPVVDEYGTIVHIQGTSSNYAMQILRSNSQGSGNTIIYVRHKAGGTWGIWQRCVSAALETLTINRVSNNYFNATDATYVGASKKCGFLTFKGNLHLSASLPTGTADVKIATISGWNAVAASFISVPAQSGDATLLVHISANGDVTISNYSGVNTNTNAWFRFMLTVPCASGSE